MISLLLNGEFSVFILIIIVFIISLTFHEFGHALAGTLLGDNTAKSQGRLTLNPISHLDPVGMLMVATVGFGWAKPVPFNPNRLSSSWGEAMVAMAGPLMNLLLAVVFINLFYWGRINQIEFFYGPGQEQFFQYMAIINLILMLFNLIPLGPLDGHYILPKLLPRHAAVKYTDFNNQYGSQALMILVLLSLVGLPIFKFIMLLGNAMLPYITFVI